MPNFLLSQKPNCMFTSGRIILKELATLPRSTEGVFLDISLPQPGILPRSWWLSLARNIPLHILESTLRGNFKTEKEKILSGWCKQISATSKWFFQNQEEMVKKSKNSINFFYSVPLSMLNRHEIQRQMLHI
jgi:hypothetical protein